MTGDSQAASVTAPTERHFVVTGANHRTAGQELRDALFIEDRAMPGFYARLRDQGIAEVVALATCDRVEVAAVAEAPETAARRIQRVLAEGAGLAPASVEGMFFTLTGPDALNHLFAIAASLESQVVGEPEVLGQVKEAHRRAIALGAVGARMGRVMEAAFAVAKRARTETAIGENAVSIVSAACQVAREVLGRFNEARAVIVGGAEFGVSVVERLKGEGLREITVADPLPPRADALAARLGAHQIAMADVGPGLAGFDIVLAGLGARTPTIRADDVAGALRARRFRPIFLLDAAVPPDVEGEVRRIDDAYLFDLHDLERIALTGQEKRGLAAAEARRIVEDEVAAFTAAESGRAAGPLVTELRAHFEEVRERLLREQPGISADEATRLLVNRLLHAPSRALRDMAVDENRGEEARAAPAEGLLARLFGLGRQGGNRGGRT